MKLLAKTLHGLEDLLAAELESLGAQEVEIRKRAVAFEGDLAMMYRANLRSRLAIRILKPIHFFRVRNDDELYARARKFDWRPFLDLRQTFAIDAVTHSPYFTHSKFAGLRLKDAIADQFRQHMGARPSVDVYHPDIRINLHIDGTNCTLSLDSSGGSLHRRGYRLDLTQAPLNEILAAGMIQLAGYTGERVFVDPMCGSGTLVIEAAMLARGIAAGSFRPSFGFQHWPDFEKAAWQQVQQEAMAEEAFAMHPILGADKDPAALKLARQNLKRAKQEGVASLQHAAIQDWQPPEGPGIVIMNPPYDMRLAVEEVGAFYKMIGNQLKRKYTGYQAWVLSPNKAAMRQIGLKYSQRYELYNGSIKCEFCAYDLY